MPSPKMKPRSMTLTRASRTVVNSPLSQQGRSGSAVVSFMAGLSLHGGAMLRIEARALPGKPHC